MPTEERFNSNLYKLLSNTTGTNPAAYSYADGSGAVLYIQSTITGFIQEFPAFLTDFSQTFQSNWSTEEVYGRNDPIATFQGTKRTISLGFDLPAGSLADATDNLNRCSNLIRMMYPGYHKTTKTYDHMLKDNENPIGGTYLTSEQGAKFDEFGVMISEKREADTGNVIGKSPLVKITFGNLIKSGANDEGLLGWIGSLSWKPNLEMGMFVAAQGEFYPKVISLSFDFNVLHQTELGQDKGKTTGTVNGWLAGSTTNKFPFK